MDYFQKALNIVDKGREGLNGGIPFNIAALDYYINGVQPAQYVLIGGETGTGKTAFADSAFVLNPITFILDFKTNPEKYINAGFPLAENTDYLLYYYSFEIGVEKKILKWITHYMWLKYGIITHYKYVISRGKHRISDEHYKLVIEARSYIDQILSRIHFIDRAKNPTGIKSDITGVMNRNGKLIKHQRIVQGQTMEVYEYVPNNPNLIVNVVIDHVGLMSIESDSSGGQRLTKKQNLDRMSQYAIELRNLYGVSFTAISQFNREIADINRQRFSELQPQLNDFKDTGNMSEDAEIVLAGFNPMNYNIKQYLGYDMIGNTGIGKRSRYYIILKNRDGEANVRFGLNFLGETGYFRDLASQGSAKNVDVINYINQFKHERPSSFRISDAGVTTDQT